MKSSNPLRRLATSTSTTWLIGIVSMLVLAFEVIAPPKPVPPLVHPTLNVPALPFHQMLTPEATGKGRKRHYAAASAIDATGIRG
jgi:hypothetical protein